MVRFRFVAVVGLLLLLVWSGPVRAQAPSGQKAQSTITLSPPGRMPTRVKIVPAGPDKAEEPNTYEITGHTDWRNPRFKVVGSAGAPAYHTVRRGDTLWSLCGSYFSDPWRWPRVWALNPRITNPHWIYPGNRILLREGQAGRRQRLKPPPLRAYKASGTQGIGAIYLRQRGFLEEHELKSVAKIVGSREEKILLATHDQVYIKYSRRKPLKVGDRYQVYKAIQAVKHPRSKRSIGEMVEIFGDVEINELSKARIARGTILKAVNPIERGYLVGRVKRVFQGVKPVRNSGTRVKGTVVAVLEQTHLIGTKQLVFIDRGKKHRVRSGYTFYVTRRGDSYRATAQFEEQVRKEERKWPREFVAQIMVVDVGENHSVGFVAKALKEIRIGDRVELLVDGRRGR